MQLTSEQARHRTLAGLPLHNVELLDEGGPGSGHYGHAGRPGIAGGSLPGAVTTTWPPAGKAAAKKILSSKGVTVTGSPTQREWLYGVLGGLPGHHLEQSGVKSIAVRATRQEVAEVYKQATQQSVPDGFGVAGFYWKHDGSLVVEHVRGTLLHEFGHSLEATAGSAVNGVWGSSGMSGSVTTYGATSPSEAWSDGYSLWARGKTARLQDHAPAIASIYTDFFTVKEDESA